MEDPPGQRRPGLTAPAYGTAALADLMPSVLASLAVPGEPDALHLPEARRCVVLLVDGLGADLLEQHAADAPFLSGLPARRLMAGFPSTTATSLASFGTGLTPGEHGLTGYSSWIQEVGETVSWLTWSALGGPRQGEDLREVLVPERTQPAPTVFERAERAGIEVTVAAPAEFRGSGLTRAVLRGGRWRGAVSPGDSVAHAIAGSRRGWRSLVYCYVPDLDLTGHVRGIDSDAWRAQLRLVDRYAEELWTRLPAGTVLHVTADHGMVDVTEGARVDADSTAGLLAGVAVLAGEPRARHVHCEPGATDDVLAAWRAELGQRMWVGRRADVLAAGLLGPRVGQAAARRVGDVVAIATGDVAVVRSRVEPVLARLLGHHGALTSQEVYVPLLSAAVR